LPFEEQTPWGKFHETNSLFKREGNFSLGLQTFSGLKTTPWENFVKLLPLDET